MVVFWGGIIERSFCFWGSNNSATGTQKAHHQPGKSKFNSWIFNLQVFCVIYPCVLGYYLRSERYTLE